MKTSFLYLFSSLALLFVTACVSVPYQPYARQVKMKPQQDGIVALKLEHRDEDRAKAQEMMTRTCAPLPVKILEEGEVVVGQETKTSGSTSHNQGAKGEKVGNLFGIPVISGQRDPSDSTQSSSSTVQLKEWQINFECEKSSQTQKSKKL